MLPIKRELAFKAGATFLINSLFDILFTEEIISKGELLKTEVMGSSSDTSFQPFHYHPGRPLSHGLSLCVLWFIFVDHERK